MQTNRENIILLPWWGETSVELTVSVDQERSRVPYQCHSTGLDSGGEEPRPQSRLREARKRARAPRVHGGAAELQGGTWDVSFDAMGSQWSGGL